MSSTSKCILEPVPDSLHEADIATLTNHNCISLVQAADFFCRRLSSSGLLAYKGLSRLAGLGPSLRHLS